MPSIYLSNFKIPSEKKLGMLGFKPGAAGWEVRMFLLYHRAPQLAKVYGQPYGISILTSFGSLNNLLLDLRFHRKIKMLIGILVS